MKRIVCLLLVFVFACSAFAGCGDNQNVGNNGNGSVDLTVENIHDYLNIYIDLGEKDVWTFDDDWRRTGEVTIKTSCKRNVAFENLSITITLKSSDKGWGEVNYERAYNKFSQKLAISYDGIYEKTFKVVSEDVLYVEEYPEFEVVVTAVSGTAVSK